MAEFIVQNQWIIWVTIFWVIPWKGVALWKSARLNQRKWFIALLIFNTLAILEILYIFVFSKKAAENMEVGKAENGRKIDL